MDPFVRRLVERLHDPARPLSRNRHFHTFETPEGRAALRLSRRLQGLATDIRRCSAEGFPVRVVRHAATSPDAEVQVELLFQRVQGKRTSWLSDDEFDLLLLLPGVKGALAAG